ncbi:MAG: chromate efflux transporter [Rhizobiaceae bacterium]|nr:chromate efflux transporter [Rhizobiaceae bacterium]
MTGLANAPVSSEFVGAAVRPNFSETIRTFGRIGLLSFGGPAGQIALMHRVLVEEKRWMDERHFLHALNYCMLLPGPEAMQLATYSGWLLHGTKGGLAAGLLFLLPGALLIIALSILYFLVGDAPAVAGLLFGLKAAVLAVVMEALLRMSRRALKDSMAVVIAVAAFAAIAFFRVPFPVIIVAAALVGVVVRMSAPRAAADADKSNSADEVPEWARPTTARFISTLAIWLAAWFGPLLLLLAVFDAGNVFVQQAKFFSVMATVTFGGAYAVLAYVAQQAVQVYGWLRPAEMLTGLGLAETTPGPLILVLVFVGFLGGARAEDLAGVAGGLVGAAVALWFTFVPCFLWIFVGAPFVERLRGVRWLASALAAVTAAVVGIIASLALWFGLHVLFREVHDTTFGPVALPVPDFASLDAWAAAIAVLSAIGLIRMHLPILAVLGWAMMVGMVVRLVL